MPPVCPTTCKVSAIGPPPMTTECVVEDVRRRCLTPECPYFAHPHPEEEEIQDGYCCNACFGRSTGSFRTRKSHYKNCLRVKHGTSRAAGEQESLANRHAQKAPRRARSSSDDLASAPAKKRVLTDATAPWCPECRKQMVWDTFAGGGYERGWECRFFDVCGYQCFRLKYHTHCESRWLCRNCEIDICEGCAAPGAAGGRGSGPSAPKRRPDPQGFRERSARELRELKSSERK